MSIDIDKVAIIHFVLAKVNTGLKDKKQIERSPRKTSPRKRSVKTEDKPSSDPVKPRPRLLSLIQDWKSRAANSNTQTHQCNHGHSEENKEECLLEDDIYDGHDVCPTLLLHGLESDWIEEEMSDDDDFK